MSGPHVEAAALESIASALRLLTEQTVAIADRHRDDPDDPLTRSLDDIERSLLATARRLERIVRSLD